MSLGLFGGYPGCHTGYVTVRDRGNTFVEDPELDLELLEQEHGEWGRRLLARNDSQYIRATGGGGYGDPLDRDPCAVAEDVRAHSVSPQVACQVYGVVIDSDAGTVNETATGELRRQLRAARIQRSIADLRPQTEVAGTGMPISEYLQLTPAGTTQCTWCGLELADRATDWKSAAHVKRRPAPDCGPLYGKAGRFWLLEVYCPGCGTLLDVDNCDGRDGLLIDRVQHRPTTDSVAR